MVNGQDVKNLILDVVSKESRLPIKAVARECKISVATASKYCYVLEAEKRIKMQSFGNMKLVSRRGQP